jgi:capsular polysaccharide biosynthesis protein
MGPDQRKPDIERLLQFFPDGRLVLIISAVLGMMAFGYYAFFMATPTFRATTTALLHKSAEGRTAPIPGQTYPLLAL